MSLMDIVDDLVDSLAVIVWWWDSPPVVKTRQGASRVWRWAWHWLIVPLFWVCMVFSVGMSLLLMVTSW